MSRRSYSPRTTPPDTPLPWVVGLTAVLAGHGGPTASLTSDWATAMTGLPLPPTGGLLPADHAALCPPPTPAPTATRTP